MEEKAKIPQTKSMNNSTLRPELNTPYTVALKYPTGIRVTGFDGWQIRYILMDGRALYIPEGFKPTMDALKLKPGQSFIVQKRAVGRKAEWSVSLPDQSPTSRDSRARRNDGSSNQKNGPQPVASILDHSEALDGIVPEDNPRLPPTQLEHALKTAVAAAAAAEKHAAEIGYPVRFKPEDIRALGITVLIGMQSGRAA